MKPSVALHEPFHDRARQGEADRLGMVVFLASEAMMFGGLFAGVFAIRILHPEAMLEAESRMHLWISAINTTILLTSSLAVAIALRAAAERRERIAIGGLLAGAVLGTVFLALKGTEYFLEYRDGLLPGVAEHGLRGPIEHLFMNLYLVATGLHALHLFIGIAALLVTAALVRRSVLSAEAVGNVGLYWHFVDIVWIFLFPALYLMRT